MNKENTLSKVEIILDGIPIETTEGKTILEASKDSPVEIPTLCHLDCLEDTGACRICLVELKEQEDLVSSCTYPVKDGLKVETDNDKIRASRKKTIELLLSDNSGDCLTCDHRGDCELAKLAYEYDIDEENYPGAKNSHPIMDDNPFFQLDYDKCILCGRCVRSCDEIRYRGAIGFSGRGHDTKVAPPLDRPLTEGRCEFCGECVDACPTGALEPKMRKGKGRTEDLEITSTICAYCGVGCGIDVATNGNEIVDVFPDENSPANNGRLCVKGRFGFDFVNSEDRLREPLIKENGNFRKASWEEALTKVAEELEAIKQEYGPDSIGGLSSATCTNEENYLFQKFVRAALGTNNVDHCARLCHSSTVAGLVRAFGSGAMTNSIREITGADTILVSGSNTTEAHPVIGLEIKKAVRNGADLIVVDPRNIQLSNDADMHLRQKSGTDVAWIMGMANIILEEDIWDSSFVEERTEDFEKFRESAKNYPPERVARITGIDPQKLRGAAIKYAEADRGMIFYAMGITQHTSGTQNVLSLANLALMTGNVGKESTGINPLRGQNNVQGACDLAALPDVYPGYQNVENPEVKSTFEDHWNIELSDRPGLTVVEMMNSARTGGIRGMYIMGENPMLSDPDINHVEKGLENLDFLAVQDIFLSDTAEKADVVLPAASFVETEGTFTNTERRVQKIKPAIEPIGESKPDWKIITLLSNKIGYPMNYDSAMEITDEIAETTPIYRGITSKRVSEKGLQWPCRGKDDPGTKFLHEDEFARGNGKFHPIEYKDPDEIPDEEYPLRLTTGRLLYHFHTGTMSRRSRGLDNLVPRPFVELNPLDAEDRELEDGEMVKVSSRRGEIELEVNITERVDQGAIFIPFHFVEAAANRLTNPALDPISKIPELKVCAAKLEKL